jgi:GntR family transcriptional regulator
MNTLLPIYYQIKERIKGWIINKEYNTGAKIPSENELAEMFNVSRLTVRQAISQLTQEGFLNRKRGEGTFVTDNENLINSFSLEFSGFMNDLFFYQISKIQIKSVEINRMVPSKMIRDKLELDEDEKEILQIKRVRFLRDRLFTYTINYLPLEIGSRIVEKDLYKKPMLQILEQDLSIRFIEAVQTIEASFASQEVAEKLEIASGSPILFVERIMYVQKRKPVEVFQSSYRGDLYKFIVRFKNVQGKDGSKWVYQLDRLAQGV